MPAEKISISFSLEIEVEDAEDKAYYLNPQTNTLAAQCIADIFDNADMLVGTLLSVNGITKQQIQTLLNAELGI
jgi:hypothetical protein